MILWYSLTAFVSAFLLFIVQPLIGKMVLPLYGGTPAVWNTCMVFFQTVLLLGYVYAHISVKWFGPRRQALTHMALLLLPCAVIPFFISTNSLPPADAYPVYWLLRILFLAVGLPFFAVSTSAPLLQRWFAATNHASSSDPYFLYSSSNAGSLLALLSYPFIFEPRLDLTEQSTAWAGGYGLLIFATLGCALLLWHARPSPGPTGRGNKTGDASRQIPLTGRQRFFWVFASFVPSSLMLSVTAYISTNIAAVPLLWVFPLALYLLTFILVFARRQLMPHRYMVRCLPLLIVPAAPLLLFSPPGRIATVLIPTHLLLFFVTAMVCHGALARSRPPVTHLTEFYVWLSVGGVLGGIFNSLVAPAIFHGIAEYPIAMSLSCLLLPHMDTVQDTPLRRRLDFLLPLLLLLCNACVILGLHAVNTGYSWFVFCIVGFVPSALFVYSFKQRPTRFALAFSALLLSLLFFSDSGHDRLLYASRNFFGVKQVVLEDSGKIRTLIHGTTIHGQQYVDSGRQTEPLAYFNRTGPLGDVFALFKDSRLKQNVGIIGLGAGSISCYEEPGQHFVFYEIDPDIYRIASDSRLFSFLALSRGITQVVLGDGRLAIANAPDHGYGMIILDAFSSDAIPVHLLTREAVRLYVSKLAKKGVVVFHISNNFVDLHPLLGNLAAELGLDCFSKDDFIDGKTARNPGKFSSQYVVMGRKDSFVGRLKEYPHWHILPVRPDIKVWTDRYSNIVKLLKW
jgi:spermidine synthase